MIDGLIHEPTEEEGLLRAGATDFLAREAPPSVLAQLRHGGSWFHPGIHRAAAAVGWLGIMVPEAYGGAGMSTRLCAALYEELGRAPLVGPLLTTAILGVATLLEADSETVRSRLLPRVTAGSEILALAALDAGPGWEARRITATLRADGDGWWLDAVKPHVQDADVATTLICAARLPAAAGGGVVLCTVDARQAGVSIEPLPGLALGLATVRLAGVRVAAADVITPSGDGWERLEAARLRTLPILSAFMAGACRALFDFTLEYTNQRQAFGQLIGRFQRVQDHVVDLANQMDAAAWMTAELLARLDAGVATAADVHETAAVAKDAYYQACNFSHMVHAGPGTDLDHPLMGHTLASRVLFQLLGTPDEHKRRMMDLRFPPATAAR